MAHYKKEKKSALEKYKESFGCVTQACAACHITRKTWYEWIKDDSDFKEAVETLRTSFVEHVESKVKEAIDKGDSVWMWRWLKAYAPDRWKDEPKFQMNQQSNALTMNGGLKLEVIRKTICGKPKPELEVKVQPSEITQKETTDLGVATEMDISELISEAGLDE